MKNASNATFAWSAGTSYVRFEPLYAGMNRATHHPTSHDSSASAQKVCAAIDTWYSQRFAEFLTGLEQATDASGASLLDRTLVVYASEVAVGWTHDAHSVPYALFGGPGVRLDHLPSAQSDQLRHVVEVLPVIDDGDGDGLAAPPCPPGDDVPGGDGLGDRCRPNLA